MTESPYHHAHIRLLRRRGRASTCTCIRCECQAAHWALKPGTHPVDRRGYAYSFNLDDYEAMCVACHQTEDRARRAALPVAERKKGFVPTVPTGVRRPVEFSHHVSFRLNDEQMAAAEAFRATFPYNSWAEAFRWIFDSPEGRELIRKRVTGQS